MLEGYRQCYEATTHWLTHGKSQQHSSTRKTSSGSDGSTRRSLALPLSANKQILSVLRHPTSCGKTPVHWN
jgi:hypothetical protein